MDLFSSPCLLWSPTAPSGTRLMTLIPTFLTELLIWRMKPLLMNCQDQCLLNGRSPNPPRRAACRRLSSDAVCTSAALLFSSQRRRRTRSERSGLCVGWEALEEDTTRSGHHDDLKKPEATDTVLKGFVDTSGELRVYGAL